MYFSVNTILFLGLILGATKAAIEDNLKELNIAGLPTNLTDLANSINAEDAERVLKEKCKKNSGGDSAFDEAKEASKKAQECIQGIVDFEVLQQEMEAAKPTGDLDLVFKKYCKKSPTLKKCVIDLTSAYEPCLEKEEIETKNTAINVTDSLVDFICFKDGDRIALFIAEGGPECLNSSSAAIKNCLEKTFKYKLEGDVTPSMESLPLFLLKAEECSKFTELQKCIVDEMEKCSETTPSNVVDSLFNFIRRHTPCKQFQTKASTAPTSGGSFLSFTSAFALVPVTLITFLLAH